MTISVTSRILAGAALLLSAARPARAADSEMSVTLLPVRHITVDGDAEKFRAHHWMNDGYAGGLKDFSSRFTLPDGTVVTTDAHALINANDFGFDFGMAKEALGFFALDFTEFRKYYDGSAGVHRRFGTLQVSDTDKQLALDIGELSLETGLTLEGWPELGFAYAREFKDGAKSRLTWGSVIEAAETRKIAPSWQDIDEIVDVFTLDARHELAGASFTAEQRWELVRSENFRVERQLSTTGAAADSKMRFQDQAPESTLMTTTLGAERNFLGEKVFVSSGYHFAHLNAREYETLIETNAAGVATNFSNPEQKPNNRADNDYDSHTWVGAVMASPWPAFSVTTKLKSEVIRREGNSAYNLDGATTGSQAGEPDGAVNRIDASLTDNKAVRWGEALGLRYTGLPRTALYTDLELEQSRVLMREDRVSIDGPDTGNGTTGASETFNRETVTDVRRGVFTIGGHVAPWRFLDVTAHVRHRRNNNDYDDQRESSPGGSTARSAFVDAQNIHTDEFAGKLTVKPWRWLRSSFRYQFRDDDFDTRIESQQAVKTGMRSHIYTYDVTVQPATAVTATAAYSQQRADITTRAVTVASGNTPNFSADVGSWLFSADYAPSRWPVTLTGALQYAQADNFNDFADTGLPLGADFGKVDAMTRLAWSVREGTSIGVEYDFFSYNGNNNVESDDYQAHALWLDLTQTF